VSASEQDALVRHLENRNAPAEKSSVLVGAGEKCDMASDAIDIQRCYYAVTADSYDEKHVHGEDAHGFALRFLIAVIEYFDIRSVLDVGSGTGRAVLALKAAVPAIRVVGIEPSMELRNVGFSKGLSDVELINGDGMNLTFGDNSFDLVCEFGALHHIPTPERAVSEMLRVSRRAIFISDSNNFGQGRKISRLVKQTIDAVGLWRIADLIKTGGKGYTISDGDGLAYSYSVFNNYKQIKEKCKSVHMFNTVHATPNLYRTAEHVALLGIKRDHGIVWPNNP
jgi:ubiquinone/menaquinone biosynthesis C-methylase UbiE